MNGTISFDGTLTGGITGGGGGGGSEVVITPVVTSGTKIADVSVDGVEKDLYCPTPSTPQEVVITPVVTSGTKIADVSIDGVEKDLYTPDYGADITSLTGRVGTAEGNITNLAGRMTEAETDISEINQSLTDLENVIEQIDGVTIYKQILNQDIVSFSTENSMSIMKLVSNIYNVNGFTEVNVTRCGKNFCGEFEIGTFTESSQIGSTYDEMKSVNSTRIRSKGLIPTFNNNIVISCDFANYQFCFCLFDADKKYLGEVDGFGNWKSVPYTPSTPSSYVAIVLKRNDVATVTSADLENCHLQVELGTTATTYEPYNGQTYNIPFVVGGNTITIYNGNYDLISGTLIDNDNSTTYHLTPTPISDQIGINFIFSDTGSIANVGYLDILHIS